MSRRAARPAATTVLLLLLLAPALTITSTEALPMAPAATHLAVAQFPGLAEGNRLFRTGRLEAAMVAYAPGWQAAREPALAYNLGTTAHHLGRLPEAVLWYRRAAVDLPDDPWLRDNMALARRTLGPPTAPAPGPLAIAAAHRDLLRWAGVALAWAALPLALVRRRAARWGLAAAALFAWIVFAAGSLLAIAGPRPAVLLADCGQELVAGSEVWVTPAGGGFRVLGTPVDFRCPAAAVGLVEP